VTRFADREREELLNRSWRSYKFDRIDGKNTTIVFSASPCDTNPSQYGWQEQLMAVTATISHLARHPSVATLRTLIWIEELHFQGWGCSECAWVLNALGPEGGTLLEEMGENYQRLRDKEFAAHVCVEHPGAKLTKTE
jgi:hypothetical protein